MSSKAALSCVSRSWYRLVVWVSIDPVLWFISLLPDLFVFLFAPLQLERSSFSRYLHGRCCGNTLLLGSSCSSGILGANGTPSSAILRGGRRRAEHHARGGEASRITADIEPPNPGFGGAPWF